MSQEVKHQTTTKSENFSLISTPPPNHARSCGLDGDPPQKDKFKCDTCECDLIWKQGLCRCNQVKMRSGAGCRVTLNPVWLTSLWEGTQTRGQWLCGSRGRDHSAAVRSQGTPRKAGEHQRLEGRIVPWSLQGEHGPASTWIWDL